MVDKYATKWVGFVCIDVNVIIICREFASIKHYFVHFRGYSIETV